MVRGTAPETLLDTYQAERHPAAARALRQTMAATVLMRPDPRAEALNETVAELMDLDEPRRVIGGLLSGLDLRYELGDGHPLLGRRMPDLDLVVAGAPVRTFALLHDARPLLIDLAAASGRPLTPGPWSDRVRLVQAAYDGPWELPVIGEVPAPAAVLVRPDGHVAWVEGAGAETAPAGVDAGGERSPLTRALERWFGPAAAPPTARPAGRSAGPGV